jgi:3-phenylpropionate/trans-cinnamate dioxygenase ferredoxin subunit
MALRLRVCRVDEVPPGTMRAFPLDGITIPILVTNLDGVLLATSSMCPHEDVSLEGGDLDDGRVICPGHGYELDLATGACTHDPALRLKTYRCQVVDGELFVELL